MNLSNIIRNKTNLIKFTGILAVVFAAATIADVVKYQVVTMSLPKVIATAEENHQQDEETVNKYLAQPKESAGGLKRRNVFAPPAAKPTPARTTRRPRRIALPASKGRR